MDTKTNLRFMLLLFLYLFLNTNICLGADSISANYSITRSQTIVSTGGVFELGFFSPGNSSNHYIGIWYNKFTSQTIVWVANREKPVSDAFSSELRISDGNLVIFDESNTSIWSTNVNSSRSASVQAVLLDSGNLVLSEVSSTSKPLWQSFDHPTDTFLPGSKIAYNKITKTSQFLTSWKSSEDPAPGLFSLELDPSDNSYVILWNRSTRFWTSGPWNGQIFSLLPKMKRDYIYDYNFVSNDNESYFTYSVYNTSIVSRWVMDVSGQIKQLNWIPGKGWNFFWSQTIQQCDVFAFCGYYGSCDESTLPFCSCLQGFEPKMQSYWDLGYYSDGCVRKTRLQCGNNGEIDKFQLISNMSLPGKKQYKRAGSIRECEATCLNICSCTAYAYESSDCLIWTEGLLNMRKREGNESSEHTLYLRLAASEIPDHKRSSQSRKLYILLFGIISVVVVIPCAVYLVYYLGRKKVVNKRGDRRSIQEVQVISLYDSEKQIREFMHSGQFREDEKKGIEVPFVVLESILAATDNFSEANILGGGGFGPVYKGKFPAGQEIAIKRLSSTSGQGLQEFKNEVLLIAKLQHRNLVRLLGYCIEGYEKMLLYEYMSNKSLDSFLFG
ncbi:hypothetical protein TIFTF001_052298 [Ficus carica]|uniref:G-type lectin S-receptor-like serine/threonine-protein kinase n=1 Tax=Ficus carica TaxID=3494 RepID=A0AA88EFN6_FICCA|nr:hypothetical protein TIFTF001_052298 [Ficus carica]